MITLPKYLNDAKDPIVRFVGIGNAGVNLADRMTLDTRCPLQVVAMNSDRQSLTSSVAPHKVVLGAGTTRGLGAGGDPEIGFEAAKESMSEIQEALSGADIIFCVPAWEVARLLERARSLLRSRSKRGA